MYAHRDNRSCARTRTGELCALWAFLQSVNWEDSQLTWADIIASSNKDSGADISSLPSEAFPLFSQIEASTCIILLRFQ